MPQWLMEYTVVTGEPEYIETFHLRVQNLIDDGWRPQGGVAVGGAQTLSTDNRAINDWVLAQAMVKD